MSDMKIKKCPFCGEKAYYWKAMWNFSGNGFYRVICKSSICFVTPQVFADTKEDAIKKWNIRRK